MNTIFYENYFKKLLPADKTARIIDFGCGEGDFIYVLNFLGYKNAEGIDKDTDKIRKGRENNLSIKEGDITKYRENCDVAILKDVLEHFTAEDGIRVLKNINEMLNENGSLILMTVNAENPMFGRLRYGDFTHRNAFTKRSIIETLSYCGFRNIKIFPQRPTIHGISSFFRYLLWRIFEVIISFYLIIENGSRDGIFTQNIIVKCEK